MEDVRHSRLPGEASWDGSAWIYLAVCGRLVEPIELAFGEQGVNCPECRSDLGLSRQTILPWSGWGRPSLRAQLPVDPP